jgi:acetyl-CoA carboxylase alpha subunit
LTSREHSKAAKTVKKAAKELDITVSKDLGPNGTSLETIVHEWTELSARNAELEELKEHLMEEIKELRKTQQRKRNETPDDE